MLAYGFERRLEIGVARQDEGEAGGMHSPHRADHNEAVRGMSQVEIGNQNVEGRL